MVDTFPGNAAHQNVQALGAGGIYGPYSQGGSGGLPVARDALDERRMAIGQIPSAQYPDGYIATIRSRRDDRGRRSSASDVVLDSLKNRITQRSYQRGVHKGERIDPSDYMWPSSWDPQRGIANQMVGVKTAPTVEILDPVHLVNDGKADTKSIQPGEIDANRLAFNSRLRPAWR